MKEEHMYKLGENVTYRGEQMVVVAVDREIAGIPCVLLWSREQYDGPAHEPRFQKHLVPVDVLNAQ